MDRPTRSGLRGPLRLVSHSLSGRLLLLTLFYVLISEAVISVPTIARYHRELLVSHIESAEIAILPFTEIGGEQFSQVGVLDSPVVRSECFPSGHERGSSALVTICSASRTMASRCFSPRKLSA